MTPTVYRISKFEYVRKTFGRCYNREAKINVAAGLPYNFEPPYPYPRNEHEEGMNWVFCNPVHSSKYDW